MTLTLVLGASGSFGRAVTEELLKRRYFVHILARDPDKAQRLLPASPHLRAFHGDVQDLAALDRAARGCSNIVHAINYPYHQWDPYLLTATERVLQVARTHAATIFFPGNVYGLGRQTAAPLDESAPNKPVSRKGEIRVRLEQSLQNAAYRGEIRAIILRAGDYFGPTVRNGYVDRIFGRAAAGEPILAFGNIDIPHQWAYVPDLARVAVDLLERKGELPAFDLFHIAGYTAHPQREFLRLVARVAGHPDLPIRVTPWWLLSTISPFNPIARELKELRYLFDESISLQDAKLRAFLPNYHDTPVEQAVADTLHSYQVQMSPA